MNASTKSQIDTLVQGSPVVLFMKGSRHFPQCGFSATVVEILGQYVPKFETVNVLSSPELRDGIKEYSSWPTIPQLYVNGKFVGGCDIVKEMHASGELAQLFGVKQEAPKAPSITLSAAARDAILAASKEAGGDPLRLEIGPRFQYDLFFDGEKPGDLVVRTDGVTMLFDAASAPRADGTHIEFVEGQGFRIDNPKEPPRVRAMTVAELKKMLDAKTSLVLLDVRTDEERALARIDGAKTLEPSLVDTLKKDAKVVVHCHHGVRSRAAAERLVAAGFTNVFNLEGGIDAWSTTVDANVPRY